LNICQKDLLIGPSGLTPVALQRASRKAYTLLEVVLALALTVLVLGGISMAINFHLITLRDQQAEIERSQIARQSLFMITKDIRSAIQYKPIESSALDELIESVESATAMAEELLGGETEEAEEPAESQFAPTRPGLYGSATALTVDVSRLPRSDQYNIVTYSDGTSSDIPSDVKTISYFVREPDNDNAGNASAGQVDINETMGLVRRSLDRAVTRYAEDYSNQIEYEDYEEVLADEINEVQFRYWDQENEAWESEWDSDEKMGLPTAVEIVVAIGLDSEESDSEEDVRKFYRSVVYLPVAEIIQPEPEEELLDTSEQDQGSDSESGGRE
jgi:hypothetical protein